MSNQNESGRLNGQSVAASDQDRSASVDGGSESTVQASQTLPLITEELAATHARNTQSTPTPSSHVSTPVMPPNPIRREEQPVSAGSATRMMQENTTAVGESTAKDDVVENAKGDDGEKKEKSESRVSATQLVAGAAAAATSSVIGGQLGVAGTVVGAGVASIITGLAVTLYTSSLDKGKEKIKEVGTKLAPAVKAKSLGAKTQRSHATSTFGSLSDEADAATTVDVPSAQHPSPDATEAANEEPKSWWQKLRRKRVLYPVTIGVATFGIGLGAVVMAESFTDADISPGTSQISRSVSGDSGTGDETGTSQDSGATSESGADGTGNQPNQNSNPGTTDNGSTASQGQSTSANEGSSTTSSASDQTGTDQGTESTSSTATGDESSGAGSDSSSSSTGTDTSGGSAGSSDSGASSGSQDGTGSSGAGSAGSSGSGSSGAGSGSGSGSAGGGSGSTAEG